MLQLTMERSFGIQGCQIPAVGLGSYQSQAGETKQLVLDAFRQGYRHIDTAPGYGTEQEIGQAIREAGIPREEIFITSKL